MSLIPAFELGIWNAWIFVVISVLITVIPSFLVSKEAMSKITTWPPFSKTERILAYSTHAVIMPVAYIYSIFLPLKLGTVWFYAGLTVYLLGFFISITALFSIASTKPGEPFTAGMYRYSRHPLAMGTLFPFIGVGIATASWLFLLLSAILAVISHFLAITEEGATAKKFGDAYLKYMEKTPRWIGIPK